MTGTALKIALIVGASALTGCASMGRVLNPFYDDPKPVALLGEPNDHALNETKNKENSAREALEHMASYKRANAPEPNDPVIQPAVVRLMWIPDHLNRAGDLVPPHYYYLKVLKDRWAVSDAFELEGQLSPGGKGASLPFVPGDEVRGK